MAILLALALGGCALAEELWLTPDPCEPRTVRVDPRAPEAAIAAMLAAARECQEGRR